MISSRTSKIKSIAAPRTSAHLSLLNIQSDLKGKHQPDSTSTILTYLVINPLAPVSILLKRQLEKNEGSLHISLVTGVNAASQTKCKPRWAQEFGIYKLLTWEKFADLATEASENSISSNPIIPTHGQTLPHSIFEYLAADDSRSWSG